MSEAHDALLHKFMDRNGELTKEIEKIQEIVEKCISEKKIHDRDDEYFIYYIIRDICYKALL
tara:strand:+ start:185 stop:370 length:186 start_codon:yes stop_codon:yes gene_type:complete